MRYYLSVGDYNKASACLVANRQIINKARIPKYNETNLHLWYVLDSSRGDYKGAFINLLAYKALEDSIFTEKKSQQIQLLQVKYETQKKDDNIKILQQNATLNQVQLKNARLTRNVTLGAIILFVLVIGMQYRRYQEKQRLNLLVTNQNLALQKLVTEKEWLLKEVHHRVKNNLHTIVCLLESQAVYLADDALKAIENSRHRIYAMSLIHQKLYQSDDIKVVDLKTYLTEFLAYLKESFGAPEYIKMSLLAESISLNATQAIPVALIINEAINNAYKYAFPKQNRGEIKVGLYRNGDEIHLSVSDNGVGFDQDAGEELNSLGLELIKGLTRELNGTINLNTANGTSINIQFEIDQADVSNYEILPF